MITAAGMDRKGRLERARAVADWLRKEKFPVEAEFVMAVCRSLSAHAATTKSLAAENRALRAKLKEVCGE